MTAPTALAMIGIIGRELCSEAGGGGNGGGGGGEGGGEGGDG